MCIYGCIHIVYTYSMQSPIEQRFIGGGYYCYIYYIIH